MCPKWDDYVATQSLVVDLYSQLLDDSSVFLCVREQFYRNNFSIKSRFSKIDIIASSV
jgi:hypothetical protein